MKTTKTKFKDYRGLPIKCLTSGKWAIFARDGKNHFNASVRDTEIEVKRLAAEWTAQSAHSIMEECESMWVKACGDETRWLECFC